MSVRLAYYTAEAAVEAMPYFDSSVDLKKEILENKKEVFYITAFQKKVVDIQTEEFNGNQKYFAVVFDEFTNSFRKIQVRTTQYETSNNCANADAPQELIERYREIIEYEEKQKIAIGDAREHDLIKKGDRVTVVSGKKVEKGTTGIVFWTGMDSWGTKKLGISPSELKVDGKYTDSVWIASSYCRKISKEKNNTGHEVVSGL